MRSQKVIDMKGKFEDDDLVWHPKGKPVKIVQSNSLGTLYQDTEGNNKLLWMSDENEKKAAKIKDLWKIEEARTNNLKKEKWYYCNDDNEVFKATKDISDHLHTWLDVELAYKIYTGEVPALCGNHKNEGSSKFIKMEDNPDQYWFPDKQKDLKYGDFVWTPSGQPFIFQRAGEGKYSFNAGYLDEQSTLLRNLNLADIQLERFTKLDDFCLQKDMCKVSLMVGRWYYNGKHLMKSVIDRDASDSDWIDVAQAYENFISKDNLLTVENEKSSDMKSTVDIEGIKKLAEEGNAYAHSFASGYDEFLMRERDRKAKKKAFSEEVKKATLLRKSKEVKIPLTVENEEVVDMISKENTETFTKAFCRGAGFTAGKHTMEIAGNTLGLLAKGVLSGVGPLLVQAVAEQATKATAKQKKGVVIDQE